MLALADEQLVVQVEFILWKSTPTSDVRMPPIKSSTSPFLRRPLCNRIMAIEMSRRSLVLGLMIKTMMASKTSVYDD